MLICMASQGSVIRTVLSHFSIQGLHSAALQFLPVQFFLSVGELAPSPLAGEFVSGVQKPWLVDGDPSFYWIITPKIVLFIYHSKNCSIRSPKGNLASPGVTSSYLGTFLTLSGRCWFLIPGTVQGQIGRGLEQPRIVERCWKRKQQEDL